MRKLGHKVVIVCLSYIWHAWCCIIRKIEQEKDEGNVLYRREIEAWCVDDIRYKHHPLKKPVSLLHLKITYSTSLSIFKYVCHSHGHSIFRFIITRMFAPCSNWPVPSTTFSHQSWNMCGLIYRLVYYIYKPKCNLLNESLVQVNKPI